MTRLLNHRGNVAHNNNIINIHKADNKGGMAFIEEQSSISSKMNKIQGKKSIFECNEPLS